MVVEEGLRDTLRNPLGPIARLSNDRKEFLIPQIRNVTIKLTVENVDIYTDIRNSFSFSKGIRIGQ